MSGAVHPLPICSEGVRRESLTLYHLHRGDLLITYPGPCNCYFLAIKMMETGWKNGRGEREVNENSFHLRYCCVITKKHPVVTVVSCLHSVNECYNVNTWTSYQEGRHSEKKIHSLSQESSPLISPAILVLIFRLLMKCLFSKVTGTLQECPQHLQVAH